MCFDFGSRPPGLPADIARDEASADAWRRVLRFADEIAA